MSVTMKELGLDKLSAKERRSLANELLDSLDDNEVVEPVISEALREHLESRIAAYEANPDDVIPWEQVHEETLARLRK